MFYTHLLSSLRYWIGRNQGLFRIKRPGACPRFRSVLIIGLYTYQSMQFDDFHTKGNQIYRTTLQVQLQESDPYFISGVMSPIGPLLRDELPEVTDYARLRSAAATEKMFIQADTDLFEIEQSFYADPQILSMFDFEILRGKPDDLLKSPFTAVMTTTLAQRVFGGQNPVGKTIQWHDDTYTVEGVVKRRPGIHRFNSNS